MALGDGFESCLEAGEWLDTVEVASLDKVGNQTLRFGPTYLNSYDHFEGSKSLIYFTRICPLRTRNGHSLLRGGIVASERPLCGRSSRSAFAPEWLVSAVCDCDAHHLKRRLVV